MCCCEGKNPTSMSCNTIISLLSNGVSEFSPGVQDFGEVHEALHIVQEHVKSH